MVSTLLIIFCNFLLTTYGQQLATRIPLLLAECGSYPYATWKETNSSGHTIFSLTNYPQTCIDCNYCQVGKTPYSFTCSSSQKNQWWNLIPAPNNPKTILLQSTVNGSTCIEIIHESLSSMQFCDNKNVNQQFIINSPKSGYIASAINTSMCLTVGDFNCTIAPFNTYPYCNQQLPTEQRVNDLVSRMTLYEKASNLQNDNIGVPRLGIPRNSFGEALHGVLGGCGIVYNNNTGCPTSFPHSLLLGATFNRTLWRDIGHAISTEVRGFDNSGQGSRALFRWTPDINLFRDPRWGRGQEVPGEDPFLTGQYVMEYSYNMQNGQDTKYLKMVSTAKHYADYDQEGNFGTGRTNFFANVSMQDQVEYYWPAWRSAVQTARVQSIMCSYNAVNGMPSCGNDYFMNQIVREEWGWDGFFVSDCGAIGDGAFKTYIERQYPADNNTIQDYQLARVALQGGCDTNCGSFYNDYLQQSVESGITSVLDVDTATKRLFTRSINLGKLDYNPRPYYTDINAYGPQDIDSPKHRALALNAAEQGIVLLKNDGNMLPLPLSNTNGKKIAMIGPHANATQDMLSNYHGTNILVNSNSPYDAMKRQTMHGSYEVTYDLGCDYLCASTVGFANAVTAASNADIAIVILGLHPAHCSGNDGAACEAEGLDRNTTELPGNQLLLLQQVYAKNKNTILVLINGGSIEISWPKTNIPAIIEAFYPGELGGMALANIIFGKVAPAGKLPYTLYDKSFLTARPSIMDMSLRGNGGITYRYYTGTPVYPFGYGLYYTNFTYKYYNSSTEGIMVVETKMLADFYRNGYYFYKSDATALVVEVTNKGNMASDCVVLGFVTSENDADAPPIKLFDFQRVFVGVGQSVNVTLSITPEAISVTNKFGNERIVPGKYHLFLGDYQNDNYVHAQLLITGEEESIFNLQKIKDKYNERKIIHKL